MKFQKKEIITLVFCFENRQEKLSSSLFKTMKIQNKKERLSEL